MEINLLEYYLRIFAFISNLYSKIPLSKIKSFLKNSVLNELNHDNFNASLDLFYDYYSYYSINKPLELNDLLLIADSINSNIARKPKFEMVLRLLLFEKLISTTAITDTENSFSLIVEKISDKLGITKSEFLNCRGFISENFYQMPDFTKLLIISDNNIYNNIPHLKRNKFSGQLVLLYKQSLNLILFIYKGTSKIYYNNHEIISDIIYTFNKGSVIRGNGFEPVYYNQVLRKFKFHTPIDLKFKVTDLEFKYKNSDHGIHKLSLDLDSEQLIGIIGRSGVGKSTLINLLIGNKIPNNGSIKINGYDLLKDKASLDGILGYVSQDDLLIEELTVFENLFYNAKLCFGDLSDNEISDKVENLLVDLDLFDVKDMQVGTPLNRLLSGGQRKKLNISLELIREPLILFADEPTSGLASSDSEEIMRLFEEQTAQGKIVVVNIHQPSSTIFKMFDKIIVLDKEGYPVYFGNPLDSFQYLNKYCQRVFLSTDMCDVCENVNPETIFKFLEEKKANNFGEYTKERKISSKEWHEYYLSNITQSVKDDVQRPLPQVKFNKPPALSQFKIFNKRNILTKLANFQYLLLTLFISPALACILAFLCRYSNNNTPVYLFSFNDNIPSYFFMSVIVALFLGLIMSAEEIIMDRKILMRESFLKLSKLSYLNSKVTYVFFISAIQTFLYVLIGNAILEIKGMLFSFWLILFSISCFANLLGLYISSILNSVIAIYILVPLIIVPQMLLSGVVINYDKINEIFASDEYVPVIGDLTASRWAYEAMIVRQFTDNEFQKLYFNVEKQESNFKFNLMFVIPQIQDKIISLSLANPTSDLQSNLQFINNELLYLKNQDMYNTIYPATLSNLPEVNNYLDKLKKSISNKLNTILEDKDIITKKLVSNLGSIENYLDFKYRHHNISLADLVLKRKDLETCKMQDNRIIRKMEPIFQESTSNYGCSHFLAASKRIGNIIIDTFYFNISIIWLMSFFTYISLISIIIINNPFKVYISHFREKRFGVFNRSINKINSLKRNVYL